MKNELYSRLKEYHQRNTVRMHMPGHKQKGESDPLWQGIHSLDVTEIRGMDDLHAPEGILKEAMARAARLWGAEESFFLVGSATAGILAAVSCVLGTSGKEVLLARNCHKSVYHACELMAAEPHYLLPAWEEESGTFGAVTAEAVREALERYPATVLVVLTSPTYEGVLSDVAGIARVCREKGAVLLVDEAHGAHLELHGVFAGGAVKAGADLVVQSLHKTLPALTQCALLHRGSDRVDGAALRRRLQMLQTSSPSYLLMASMDRCVRRMESEGETLLSSWRDSVRSLREGAASLRNIALFSPASGGFDPTKITLHSLDPSCSGKELARRLEERGVVAEMSLWQNCLLYTGAMTDREDARRTLDALRRIDGTMQRGELLPVSYCSALPKAKESFSRALALPTEEIPLREAAGRICADYLWAYPPGIPLLCPGEVAEPEVLFTLESLAAGGGRLLCAFGGTDGRLRVAKKTR